MQGKPIDELMTVTVQPGRRGARTFDYDLIDIDWKAHSVQPLGAWESL